MLLGVWENGCPGFCIAEGPIHSCMKIQGNNWPGKARGFQGTSQAQNDFSGNSAFPAGFPSVGLLPHACLQRPCGNAQKAAYPLLSHVHFRQRLLLESSSLYRDNSLFPYNFPHHWLKYRPLRTGLETQAPRLTLFPKENAF